MTFSQLRRVHFGGKGSKRRKTSKQCSATRLVGLWIWDQAIVFIFFCSGIKRENLPDAHFLRQWGAIDTTGFDWMGGRNGDGRFAPLPAGE